jgi:kexin
MPENELNVTKLWDRGITGTGVKIALIDDGLDYTSGDLKDNFVRLSAP